MRVLALLFSEGLTPLVRQTDSMKNTQVDGLGGALQTNDVKIVYPLPNPQFNPSNTIHTQTVDSKTTLYRNHRGRVLFAESERSQ